LGALTATHSGLLRVRTLSRAQVMDFQRSVDHVLVHFLYRDQVRHGVHHPANLGTVLFDNSVVHSLQTQAAQRLALVALISDTRLDLGDFQVRHFTTSIALFRLHAL